MKTILTHFPYLIFKTIPRAKETKQLFLLPGIIIGKWYITFFWLRKMLTINFNTKLELGND